MAQIDIYLEKYGESHQNAINKFIHWVCVPAIMFSLFGILYSIPFFIEKTIWFNWATPALVAALVFYWRLSMPMFFGFVFIGGVMVLGNHLLARQIGDGLPLVKLSLGIFVAAWIVQFIGHKIEGKKPSFIDDLKFLLIGPAWLLHFIYLKMGIRYS